MTSLLAASVSITATQRGRYFWAAWWTSPPVRVPFRKPDASNGGAKSHEDAVREAQRIAGVALAEIDPRWARGWIRIIRGQAPFTERDVKALESPAPAEREVRATATSIWTELGVEPTATLAQIKRAYKTRALATHPDQGGDGAEFRALHAAYERAIERRAKTAKRPAKKTAKR